MLGFSLQKLLVLAAIILAVWYGFRFLSRLQDSRGNQSRMRTRVAPSRGPKRRPTSERAAAEDMIQCPVCEAYVPARGTSACGRTDCPY